MTGIPRELAEAIALIVAAVVIMAAALCLFLGWPVATAAAVSSVTVALATSAARLDGWPR